MGCELSVLDMNRGSPGEHTLTYWENDVLIVSNTGYINALLDLSLLAVLFLLLLTAFISAFTVSCKKGQQHDFYNMSDYRVTNSSDPDMSSAPWCVVSHLLLITSFVSLSRGVQLSEVSPTVEVPAGILAVQKQKSPHGFCSSSNTDHHILLRLWEVNDCVRPHSCILSLDLLLKSIQIMAAED